MAATYSVYSSQHATSVLLPVSHTVQISAGKEDEAARVTARSRSDTVQASTAHCSTAAAYLPHYCCCCCCCYAGPRMERSHTASTSIATAVTTARLSHEYHFSASTLTYTQLLLHHIAHYTTGAHSISSKAESGGGGGGGLGSGIPTQPRRFSSDSSSCSSCAVPHDDTAAGTSSAQAFAHVPCSSNT
eukprot:10171-Heterococcus_DN1.PRE.3